MSQSEPVNELQKAVDTALGNAEENGYFDEGGALAKMDANGIATDILEYDSDVPAVCEKIGYDPEQDPKPLIEAVETWLRGYNVRISRAWDEILT